MQGIKKDFQSHSSATDLGFPVRDIKTDNNVTLDMTFWKLSTGSGRSFSKTSEQIKGKHIRRTRNIGISKM